MSNQFQSTSFLDNSYHEVKYNVGDLPFLIVKDETINFPEQRTFSNWASGLVTVYVQSGTMMITVNGIQKQVHKNDICIIDAGCVHFFERYEDHNCIFFCGIVDESLFTTTPEIANKYIYPVFHAFHPNIDIIPAASPYNSKITNVFQQIHILITEKPAAYELYIIAYFHQYLGLLCEALKNSFFLPATINSKTDISMRHILAHIHTHYSKAIKIADLCAVGIVSRNQCFQLFNRYTGDTPANYIIKYRLLIAQQLLIQTSLSISEIATECGFTHQSHFTNHFTRQYSITPLQFRKQYLNK